MQIGKNHKILKFIILLLKDNQCYFILDLHTYYVSTCTHVYTHTHTSLDYTVQTAYNFSHLIFRKYSPTTLFPWLISIPLYVVQSLSHVWLFATPWSAAYQASLSYTISQSSFKLMSIELVIPSSHLIFCCAFSPALSLSQSSHIAWLF